MANFDQEANPLTRPDVTLDGHTTGRGPPSSVVCSRHGRMTTGIRMPPPSPPPHWHVFVYLKPSIRLCMLEAGGMRGQEWEKGRRGAGRRITSGPLNMSLVVRLRERYRGDAALRGGRHAPSPSVRSPVRTGQASMAQLPLLAHVPPPPGYMDTDVVCVPVGLDGGRWGAGSGSWGGHRLPLIDNDVPGEAPVDPEPEAGDQSEPTARAPDGGRVGGDQHRVPPGAEDPTHGGKGAAEQQTGLLAEGGGGPPVGHVGDDAVHLTHPEAPEVHREITDVRAEQFRRTRKAGHVPFRPPEHVRVQVRPQGPVPQKGGLHEDAPRAAKGVQQGPPRGNPGQIHGGPGKDGWEGDRAEMGAEPHGTPVQGGPVMDMGCDPAQNRDRCPGGRSRRFKEEQRDLHIGTIQGNGEGDVVPQIPHRGPNIETGEGTPDLSRGDAEGAGPGAVFADQGDETCGHLRGQDAGLPGRG